MTDKTKQILADRGKIYGNYFDECEIISKLRDALNEAGPTLTSAQENSLRMICMKLARIVNGNPNHEDNWRDIAGYATLIADRLGEYADEDKAISEAEAVDYIKENLGVACYHETDGIESRVVVTPGADQSPVYMFRLLNGRVILCDGSKTLSDQPRTTHKVQWTINVLRTRLANENN